MPIELNKERFKAVHDDDLLVLLERLGVLGKIRRGEVKCEFCKGAVTLQNLHSLFPSSGAVKIVCDSPECIKALATYVEERQPSANHGN